MMRKMGIERSLAGIIAASFLLLPTGVVANEMSDDCFARLSENPLTVVVPNDAGGGYDIYARAFASGLEKLIDTSIRVANMPAAGGRLAYAEVVQQDANEIVLLVDNISDLVAAADTDPTLEYGSDAFTALGLFISEPAVWLGRPDIDLADPSLEGLVLGANAIGSTLIEGGLVARALNLNLRVVAGYDGSSETTAAVMRNETDIAIVSINTALRRSEGTDLKVLLVLQDEAHPSAPDALVFGGSDGLVEQRAKDLSDAERAARRVKAEMATALSGSYRAVMTGAHLANDVLQCLRSATDTVLQADVFTETAVAQGRPVAPVLSARTAALFEQVRRSQSEVIGELESLEAELVK